MPRSSRGSAPARRSAPAPAPAPAARQAAPASIPAQHHQQPHQSGPPAQYQQPSQGPGLMGQIAANAASVAIGSTMARGLSSALGFGGGYAAEAPAAAAPPVDDSNPQYAASTQQAQQYGSVNSCQPIAADFTRCLEATKGDIAPCQYYLDQFKACQAAAAPY